MRTKQTPAPWEEGHCNCPVWMLGAPSGHCGEKSYGHQLPSKYLYSTRSMIDVPYCFGHACQKHGGPKENEVRIFQDGITKEGRPMWCAVMPDFIDLQASPAGFDGNPLVAVANLLSAIAKATNQQGNNHD